MASAGRMDVEHLATETTAFPIDADFDVDPIEPTVLGASDANEASLHAQALDAGAFSAENLSGSTDAIAPALDFESDDDSELGDSLGGDFDTDFGEDPGDETDEVLMGSFRSDARFDLTPVIDATDELTSPLVQAAVETSLRSIKVLDAIPIAMSRKWVEIDATPRGKSKVPFSRIQTISMVAVGGLGPRPVLIVDALLNGSDGMHAPIKVIRFRSDRFDPLEFEAAAESPLAALTAWVKRLQVGSNAICLPSREILAGEFSRFESLEDYERRVLTAVREDGI